MRLLLNLILATNQIQERRSERLKKDATLTNVEEVERNAHKTNLEGNSYNYNSFSALLNDDIAHVTFCMGIVVEDNSFDTFNLVRDLEKARDDLYQKQMLKNQKPQTESFEGIHEDNVP